MTPKQVNDIFNKLPPKRQKVLVGFLAGHSREKIMIDADVPSDAALTGHLKELYKNFRIDTGWNDADDRRSGARKLPLLISLFARCKPELISDRISDVLDNVEQEEAIAKPHQETGELIETSASDLNFERYSELERLLTAKQWQEANEETRIIMLNIASREIEGSLRAPDINKFPCQDLHTIDKLWVEYSNRHFGFSVQKRIWKDVVKSRSNPNYRTLCRFGERVGWQMNGSWLSCPDLSFAENSAPVGHLPATFFIIYGNLLLNSCAYLESRFETQAEHGSRLSASFFFSRVETCKL